MPPRNTSLLTSPPDNRPPFPLLAPHDRLQHLPQVSLGDRRPSLGHQGLAEFVQKLTAIRQALPMLRRGRFLTGEYDGAATGVKGDQTNNDAARGIIGHASVQMADGRSVTMCLTG